MILRLILALCLLPIFGVPMRAETPQEWVTLLTRVHGGFGSFLPVGIRIGEDAIKRPGAKPRELAVTFYQGNGVPCPCPLDGVMLAVGASPGRYTVPISFMPKLGEINRTIQDPLARYDAVMALPDLYTVETVK